METIEQGQPIECNRCAKTFAAPKTLRRAQFGGSRAARIETFCACPHCGQTDSHWFNASHVMPTFEGGFDARKRAERKWLSEN